MHSVVERIFCPIGELTQKYPIGDKMHSWAFRIEDWGLEIGDWGIGWKGEVLFSSVGPLTLIYGQ